MEQQKWVIVKGASTFCYQMGLPRSTKSIRRWCANGDIEAEKRPNGRTEQWFINKESLEIKIKEELEFLKQSERSFSQPVNTLGHSSDMSGHKRTRPDTSAFERSQADTSGHEWKQRPDASETDKNRKLEDEILILKTDLKWRDKVISDQKQANETLLEEVKGQSRYIGHLETNLLQLGGKTDQTFLEAPVPKSGRSEDIKDDIQVSNPDIVEDVRPHPDQTNLYSG